MFIERTIKIISKLGLHVRPAAEITEIASKYHSEITIIKNGHEVNAKSIIELLALGAGEGSLLTLRAKGKDAHAALDEIQKFIENKFREE